MREIMMEREGSKPNAAEAPNAATTFLSFAKNVIRDKSSC
jgi:hypothetical protein